MRTGDQQRGARDIAQWWALAEQLQCTAARAPGELALRSGVALGEDQGHQRNAEQAQACGNRRGPGEVGRRYVVARQHAANRRTDGEADTDSRADQPERRRSLARFADIGGVGKRSGNVARHETAQHARGEQPPRIVGQTEHDIRNARATQTGHQDHAPSMAIAQPTPERRRQELEQRVGAEDRGDPLGRNAETVPHVGHQRNQNPEAQNIDDADAEESQEPLVQILRPLSVVRDEVAQIHAGARLGRHVIARTADDQIGDP